MLVIFLTLTAQCLHLAVGMLGPITSTDAPQSGLTKSVDATMCKPLNDFCHKICLNGYVADSDGCLTCECFNPDHMSNSEIVDDTLNKDNSKCTPLTCNKVCKFGYYKDDEGCLTCQCAKPMCTVAGDPYYTTFDEEQIEFQGRCNYVLSATDKERLPKSLTNFVILVRNKKAMGSERSYTELVHIDVANHRISVKDHGQLIVDDIPRTLEAETKEISDIFGKQKFKAWKEENIVHFVASNMFRVSADLRGPGGRHFIKVVILNPGYRNYMQGMCGNFNNNGTDDHNPQGLDEAGTDTEVGNSWIADSGECI